MEANKLCKFWERFSTSKYEKTKVENVLGLVALKRFVTQVFLKNFLIMSSFTLFKDWLMVATCPGKV